MELHSVNISLYIWVLHSYRCRYCAAFWKCVLITFTFKHFIFFSKIFIFQPEYKFLISSS
uniref:Uncharacterized protein n=1 Tax=Octopus bimaculoides TaxID=37653 RepID=A0A0L8FVM2_OCTBM